MNAEWAWPPREPFPWRRAVTFWKERHFQIPRLHTTFDGAMKSSPNETGSRGSNKDESAPSCQLNIFHLFVFLKKKNISESRSSAEPHSNLAPQFFFLEILFSHKGKKKQTNTEAVHRFPFAKDAFATTSVRSAPPGVARQRRRQRAQTENVSTQKTTNSQALYSDKTLGINWILIHLMQRC